MYDLIIIGGGPAGLACGIEARKEGLEFLILEKGVLANSIYHFPANMTFFSTSQKLEIGDIPFISHTEKPTRREALEYYRRIVASYDLPIQFRSKVLDVKKEGEAFTVIIEGMDNLISKNIIVSTGYYDTPRKLNIPGENLDKVIHYYDDAHRYIGQNILVIGGANSACDVALETWNKGANVTMVVRKSELYQRVKYWILPNIENRIKEGSIKAYFDSKVLEIRKKTVLITTPEGEKELENDYVLAMTGYKPDFEFLEKIGIQFSNEKDKIPALDAETLESNVSSIYLAGVVNSGMLTSKLFIENTREHGKMIIGAIKERK